MAEDIRPLASCMCRRYNSQCGRTATQEDLLCDVCRGGCGSGGTGFFGGPMTVVEHIKRPVVTWRRDG